MFQCMNVLSIIIPMHECVMYRGSSMLVISIHAYVMYRQRSFHKSAYVMCFNTCSLCQREVISIQCLRDVFQYMFVMPERSLQCMFAWCTDRGYVMHVCVMYRQRCLPQCQAHRWGQGGTTNTSSLLPPYIYSTDIDIYRETDRKEREREKEKYDTSLGNCRERQRETTVQEWT